MFHFPKKIYFDGNISHGFVSLYTGKTIVEISSGLLGIFLPIFLYELFDRNAAGVVAYFGIASILYLIALAPGASFLNIFGFRRGLRASVFLGALYFAFFYFMDESNLLYLIPLSIITLTLFRIFYWIPYHTDFAKFTDKKNRAREVSAVYAMHLGMGVFIPALSGFLITQYDFDVVFIIAIILYLASGIPYLTIPHTEEKYELSYRAYIRELLSEKRRRVLLAHTAAGAESFVGLYIWPLFIFELLKGNYLHVGAISTLIIGATVILQLSVGKIMDEQIAKKKILEFGSFFYALGWVVKIFIATASEIFITGVYHNIAKIFTSTPFETITYEIAADEGRYVDEFTVLKETAVHAGRIIMAALIFAFASFLAIQWTFALAAIAAIAMNLIWSGRAEQKTVSV